MSSVSVSYGLKTIKVKVTPGTPASDIVERAATHFKLDSTTMGLFHNTTELSKSLPFRLLNLPSGVKLTLKASSSYITRDITIKIQFINFNFDQRSVVKKFSTSATVKDVIESVEKELDVNILNRTEPLKFQSISKTIDQQGIRQTTLSQLGVENNGVMRVSISTPGNLKPITAESNTSASTKTLNKTEGLSSPGVTRRQEETSSKVSTELNQDSVESKTSINHSSEAKSRSVNPEEKMEIDTSEATPSLEVKATSVETVAEPEIPQHVYVYKPPSSPIPQAVVEDSIYEVTVSHARLYQNMLSQKARETPKERRLREANKKPISNVEVRIRFPDGSNVQVNFKPDQTNAEVYQFVRGTLVHGEEDFKLHIPYPPIDLADDNSQLTVSFESRNLVLFQGARKTGTFLKDEYLSQAKDINDAEEVKQERNRHLLPEEAGGTPDTSIHNGVLPKKNLLKTSDSQESGGKKLPKWLKLGKK